tara:strand:- start:1596 stop:2414 length:819 start_codon:yes stop_codon:yes gene_type:complete
MESKLDLEAEYDNRTLVPEHVEILPRWEKEAAEFRATHSPETLRYGAAERNLVDVFRSAESAARRAPVVLFIHGGYWRGLSKDMFSHMAGGLLAHGLDVAMPNYTLCPDIGIPGIGEELKACCRFLGETEKRPLMMTGHSAGGHLAAFLCQKSSVESIPVPVIAGLGISGVYDLTAMLHVSMNVDLKLDLKTALAASPYFAAPEPGISFDAWVGSDESNEFLRQSEDFASKWRENSAHTTYIEIAGANHFTAVEPLLDQDSLLVKRIAALAG